MYNSLAEIQSLLAEEKISCVDLVKQYLLKIHEFQHLNAFLEVFAEEALDKAAEIDNKSSGKKGKLAGMILGLKDNICYKNHKVTASSRILEGFVSLYNATAVERLISEDAIIIGRLNCDEFAMGGSNENSAYGNVLNPLDNTRVPGGSSGGSAAAVAAGLCLSALGSDTGGSIRQPASFCGIVGLKPSYGRISRHGLVAYGSSFDQIGPLTKNVEDAAILLEVMSGKDEYDSTASQNSVPAFSQLLVEKINPGKISVGYIKECLESKGLDPEVRKRMHEIIDQLQKTGVKVEPVEFHYLDYVVPAYYILTTAEASSNLARYDGLRYGYRSNNAVDLESTYKKSRTEGFGKEVKRRIMLGTFVLSAGYYDAYYSKAQKIRRLIRDNMQQILADYNFILMPTTPHTAFKIGENSADPLAMYLEDIFTVQANLSGLPAVSLPLGQHSNGLPFGIQLISGNFEEARLLQFSKWMMEKRP